jgi:hypothetical protein
MKYSYIFAAALVSLAACDGSTGPKTGGTVAIQFGTSVNSNIVANAQLSGGQAVASDLTVTGTNGTLVIQDIRFIISRLELKQAMGATCTDSSSNPERDGDVLRADHGSNGGGDDGVNHRGGNDDGADHDANDDRGREHDEECDEFEGGPFQVDLPLAGLTSIATDNVPAGTYDAFSFRIRGLDADNEDGDDSAEVNNAASVLAQIRTFYPNFPGNASMVVKGTFNGTPFTTYFRSKLEIEQQLATPLVVPGDNALQVMIDPSAWFRNGTQVLDLAALNGQTVDLGNNFRNGVKGEGHDRRDD